MKVIFLDTETTDLDDDARLVQLAYKIRETGEELNQMFNPEKKISIESMSIHHITDEMVLAKENFASSKTKEILTDILKTNILVAHNAPFDIKILENEGIEVNHDKYIDTCRVSQHLLESDNHKLQYLRYLLNLNLEGQIINPHDAWSDILVLEVLFDYLAEKIKKDFNLSGDEEILERMILLSKTPIILKVLKFGKYKDQTFAEVAKNDKSYLEWLYNSEISKIKTEQNENLVFTLKNHLNLI
jgi:DNA polymerase-3 subunit epsilon/exodeoxyribonuclease X